MSLKLHVNISRKVGLPDYGSAGAGCGLELELDQSMLANDPDGLQIRVRQAYAACRQAVNEELEGQKTGTPHAASPTSTVEPRKPAQQTNGHQASDKQLSYARQLAGQIEGVGVRRLNALAQKMFGKPIAGLTSLDASGLIDTLKEIKAGKIDLAAALNGVAT